jgi:hypothetical protein
MYECMKKAHITATAERVSALGPVLDIEITKSSIGSLSCQADSQQEFSHVKHDTRTRKFGHVVRM